MRNVRLNIPSLVGSVVYAAGAVVSVPDDRAHSMVANDQGVFHTPGRDELTAEDAPPGDDHGAADNAGHVNPLADVLTPIPRGEIPVNPADAIAPHVGENPGLDRLAKTLGVKGERSPSGRTSTIPPVPTSDVASPEAVEASHRLANPPAGKAPTPEEAAAMVAARDEEREAEGEAETADIRPGGRTASRATGKARTKATPPAETEVKTTDADTAAGTPGPVPAEAPKPA
jgi:hypothetical protein